MELTYPGLPQPPALPRAPLSLASKVHQALSCPQTYCLTLKSVFKMFFGQPLKQRSQFFLQAPPVLAFLGPLTQVPKGDTLKAAHGASDTEAILAPCELGPPLPSKASPAPSTVSDIPCPEFLVPRPTVQSGSMRVGNTAWPAGLCQQEATLAPLSKHGCPGHPELPDKVSVLLQPNKSKCTPGPGHR